METQTTNTVIPPPQSHVNRLAKEKSPYLLQHQHNPVNWFPWCDEAFKAAHEADKPIFLSIGYSTCHWCHVMERESFENQEVADFLNEHFISIKVDREERPDVDKIYMSAVQAFSGQGGWPLTAFLTPDLKPFYGGTYYPPVSRHGLPGFLQLLRQIHQVWIHRRNDLLRSAGELHHRLGLLSKPENPHGFELTPALLHDAAAHFMDEYDEQYGGFGGAPKFPRPSVPQFLLRYGNRFRDQDAIDMVLFTCDRMAAGGIHDHLGGGFARYAVDERWLVPHFEKMLYDNAQMAQLYLDAFVHTGEVRHRNVVRDIMEYVLRDMTHPQGGFYSAEDADSEGREGKFYCWTGRELRELLSPDEFLAVEKHYGITEGGNFIDHSDPDPLTGLNVLHIASTALSAQEQASLASGRARMLQARSHRIRPQCDDKILASWNGLMLGAMARAGILLRESRYLESARKTAAFIKEHLWDSEKKCLYHRWREGEHDSAQILNAYAFLMSGMLDLYECTLEPEWLRFSKELACSMTERFYDAEQGGFWQSLPNDKRLILRLKEDYDGAEPAGNSVAIHSLLRLSAMTGETSFQTIGEKSLKYFTLRLHKLPQAVPYLLLTLDFHLAKPERLVLTGDHNSPAFSDLLRTAHSVWNPYRVIVGNHEPADAFAQTLAPRNNQPTAYYCSGHSCQEPATTPAQLEEQLSKTVNT